MPDFLSTRQETYDFLKTTYGEYFLENGYVEINDDGSINVLNNFTIDEIDCSSNICPNTYPVKIRQCTEAIRLSIITDKISDFSFLPERVHHLKLYLSGTINPDEVLPQLQGLSVDHLELNFPLTTVSKIHKYLKFCKVITIHNHTWIGSGILSLLMVKGLEEVHFTGAVTEEIIFIDALLQNNLKTRDILSCQEALIDAGLKSYATT